MKYGIGVLVGLCVCLWGCASEEEEGRSRRSGSSTTASSNAGSGGSQDFGNSTTPPPPPPQGTGLSVSGGSCKAGHYIGKLDGLYHSPITTIFAPPIPVTTERPPDLLGGTAAADEPGFEFWLEAAGSGLSTDCEGSEFCVDFRVTGGKMRGVANGLFPFEADLNGELDCDNGLFRGTLENGWYEAFALRYMYEGTLDASYDAAQAQFFDGVWSVTEPADPLFGGDGTWYAGWVMD